MIGDDIKDVQAGRAAGCRTVWLRPDAREQPGDYAGPANTASAPDAVSDYVAVDLFEAVEWLLEDA